MSIINTVKEHRKEMNLSQLDLSIISGIGRSTISNIETGKYIPGVDVALMIAKVLNCSVDELFRLEGD